MAIEFPKGLATKEEQKAMIILWKRFPGVFVTLDKEIKRHISNGVYGPILVTYRIYVEGVGFSKYCAFPTSEYPTLMDFAENGQIKAT